MSAMTELLSAGIFAAILPVGLWWAGRLPHGTARSRLVLAAPLGVVALSIPLAAMAMLGAFRPAWLGALGWMLVVVSLAGVRPSAFTGWRGSLTGSDVGVVLIVVVTGVLYLGFPSETPLGVRDEGLYTLGALALERTGSLSLARPPGFELAPTLFAPFVSKWAFFLPGIYDTPEGLQFQFPPLLPAWIAQLYSTLGDAGLYRISAVFALLSIPSFHLLLRRFVRPPIALAGTALFAFNPAQVWIARMNLSEPASQLLLLGGLVLLVDWSRLRDRGRLVAASVAFGLASFLRLDSVLIPLLIMWASVVAALWLDRRDATAGARLAQAALAIAVSQLVALCLLYVSAPIYIRGNAATLKVAVMGLGAGAVLLPLVRALPVGWLRSDVLRARLHFVSDVALVGWFSYAAFVRPSLEPFATIDLPGSVLHGARDFREVTLVNLQAYLTWVSLLLGLAGVAIALGRALAGRARAGLALAVILGTGVLAVFLTRPQISPDHFWAIRRFVPLAIPAVILFAAYGLQALLRGAGIRRISWVGAMLAAVATGEMLYLQRATLLVGESPGLTAQLRQLDASLPKGTVLARDVDGIATTLFVGFGRPVLPMRGAATSPDAARFFATCPANGCTLLHAPTSQLDGLAVGSSREGSLARRVIVPTTSPLPHEVARDFVPFRLTQLRKPG
jgi:hypothetical protein